MKKTLVLVGGGAKSIYQDIRDYVNLHNLPIVYSLNGKGIIDDNYNLLCGMIGWKGNKYANSVLDMCERLIIIGSRLDIRQITNLDILKGKELHLVMCDTDKLLNAVCYKTFNEFKNKFTGTLDTSLWFNEVNYESEGVPNLYILSLKQQEYSITTDVGSNQMLCANWWNIDNPYKWITSGGLGTMGYAIPSAIGVACQGNPTIAICGDGGFQMNSQELETIIHYDLPIKIIVMNNNILGLVKEFQDDMKLINQSTVDGYSCPNIQKVVEAYGFKYTLDENEFISYNKHIVLEILSRKSESTKLLSKVFNVSQSHICRILNGTKWRYLHV